MAKPKSKIDYFYSARQSQGLWFALVYHDNRTTKSTTMDFRSTRLYGTQQEAYYAALEWCEDHGISGAKKD